jgi:hypothetical protein
MSVDYTGSFSIPTPKGVYQAAGDTNVAAEYAYDAVNMRTERGLLATAYGVQRAFVEGGNAIPPLDTPIGTLERFYRRNNPADPEVYVAATNGEIHTYTPGTGSWKKQFEGFKSDIWSSVTYEAVVDGATVDILIMSNAEDGMIVVYGSDLHVEKKALTIGNEYAEVKFAVLGRHAERIWGTGDKNHPDTVFYSKSYNPFDWKGDDVTPQIAGGMIGQPTWDGESFVALAPFGGYLLAIKPSTCFEIRGTDPSNFTITEAYGTDGPIAARTVCTDRQSMFYLGQSGLGRYDGASLALLSRDALYEVMQRRRKDLSHLATACVCNHVYYLAIAVGGEEVQENNTVIEFDSDRGTFMIREGMRVKDFYSLGGHVYYTQADAPYDVLLYGEPRAQGILGAPMTCRWETAWLDLGKPYVKRDFVLRFTAQADEDNTPLEIYVITDRREKVRVTMLQKQRRDYRVKIQNAGVRMKLRICSNTVSGWQIHGGVLVEYSFDQE